MFAQACIALDGDDADRAVSLLQRLRADAPKNAVVHYFLGRAYGRQAQKANVLRKVSLARQTRDAFSRAVALDPDYVDARLGLVEYFWQAPRFLGGSHDRAREQALEIQRRNPFRGGLALATLAERVQQWDEAVRHYEQLIRTRPDSLIAWTSLVQLYGARRQWDEATQVVDRLQEATPGSLVPSFYRGWLAVESSANVAGGEAALRRYLAIAPQPGEPTHAAAHYRLGRLLEQQGKVDAARAEYTAAQVLNPDSRTVREALARLTGKAPR